MPFVVSIGDRSNIVAGIEGQGSIGVHLVEYTSGNKPTTVRVNAFRDVAPHETESIEWRETEINVGETVTVQYVSDGAPTPPAQRKTSRDDARICVHDRATAKAIRDCVNKFNAQMLEFIPQVKSQASSDDFRKFTHSIGHVLYEVHDRFLAPIYARHPDLGPTEQKLED